MNLCREPGASGLVLGLEQPGVLGEPQAPVLLLLQLHLLLQGREGPGYSGRLALCRTLNTGCDSYHKYSSKALRILSWILCLVTDPPMVRLGMARATVSS